MILPGTLSNAEAAATTWDAIVIGAGVSGSMAAREIARLGGRVLLVDRRPFPRRKVCGACLNGLALTVLAEAGLSREIDDLGGDLLQQFSLRCGSRTVNLPLPAGRAISREALDAALVRAAIASGVEFLSETTARVGGVVGDRREIRLCPQTHPGPSGGSLVPSWENSLSKSTGSWISKGSSPNGNGRVGNVSHVATPQGQDFFTSAAAIIIAAGLGANCLPNTGEWTTHVRGSSRVGAGCMVEDFSSDFAPGTIWMTVGDGGYLGLVRVEDGRLNLAAAFDRGFLRRCGSPRDAALRLLTTAKFPIPSQLMEADWQGTVSLNRQTAPVASRRVFLIGDAAGYVEPFTGEGMAWALLAGRGCARWAVQATHEWSDEIALGWIWEYRALIQTRQTTCRVLGRLLHYPRLLSGGLSLLGLCPGLTRYVIKRLNTEAPQGRLVRKWML
jgi:flavin-dependent dehydrogenase